MQLLQSGVQERKPQCQTVSKNMLWGCTFKAFKTSGNWGYLIKRPSGRQCVNGYLHNARQMGKARIRNEYVVWRDTSQILGKRGLRRQAEETEE